MTLYRQLVVTIIALFTACFLATVSISTGNLRDFLVVVDRFRALKDSDKASEDFRDLVEANGGEIEREIPLLAGEWRRKIRRANVWPNLLADTAVAVVRAKR